MHKIPSSIPSFTINGFALLSGNDHHGLVVLSDILNNPVEKEAGISITLAIRVVMAR